MTDCNCYGNGICDTCRYGIPYEVLSSRTLGFTNHAGVCPVFDVETNEIIDTLSSTEEVLKDYPTATWYDHL